MPTYALIMSGGGARGAYEAGVLSWVLDDLPRGREVEPEEVVVALNLGPVHQGLPLG